MSSKNARRIFIGKHYSRVAHYTPNAYMYIMTHVGNARKLCAPPK